MSAQRDGDVDAGGDRALGSRVAELAVPSRVLKTAATATMRAQLGLSCTTAMSLRAGSAREGAVYAGSLRLPSGNSTVCVWEAFGHGAQGTLLVRAGLYALLGRDPNVESAAIALNRVIVAQSARNATDDVVSGFFGVVDRSRRRLRFVSCGHDTAILFDRSGGHEHLVNDGPPLGARSDSTFASHEVGFDTGDVLVIATAGIAEARDLVSRTRVFGSRGLSSLFAAAASEPQPDAASVVASAMRFSGGSLANDAAALVARAH